MTTANKDYLDEASVHWWNPLAWWASRNLRQAQEACCDAWVIWTLPDSRRSYGQALLQTLEFLTVERRQAVDTVTAFGRSQFKRRIEVILKRNVSHRMSRISCAVVLFIALFILPVAASHHPAGQVNTTGRARLDSSEAPSTDPMPTAKNAASDTSESVALSVAVKRFNEKATQHWAGRKQPPLTIDEVVAAIRGWDRSTGRGATDEVYNMIQQIAESEILPPGAELSFIPRYVGYRGYTFDVWWVDLSIRTSGPVGYTFRIRNNMLSSRKLTPEELEEMEKERREIDKQRR